MPQPDPNPMCLDLDWGGDFSLNPDGTLKMASGVRKANQRIIRRLYTNCREVLADGQLVIGDYYFAQDYGLSCPRLIGEPFGADFVGKFTQKVKAAVLVDESADVTQDPIIQYFSAGSFIYGTIQVFLLNNQETQIVAQLQKVAS